MNGRDFAMRNYSVMSQESHSKCNSFDVYRMVQYVIKSKTEITKEAFYCKVVWFNLTNTAVKGINKLHVNISFFIIISCLSLLAHTELPCSNLQLENNFPSVKDTVPKKEKKLLTNEINKTCIFSIINYELTVFTIP